MHELPVTESVLEITLRHAQAAEAKHVNEIHLVIGELASIIDDSVQFYWDIVSKDTIAEGARLNFRRIPAEMLCYDCQTRFFPSSDDYACPNCGSARLKIVAGNEFFVEAIDIET
jgi:hydrogenase nickel incorporation protein HypA/HybF